VQIQCSSPGQPGFRVISADVPSTADPLLGLMFHRALSEQQGVWLDMDRQTRFGSAIHMLFVFFPIAVFWLDRQGNVVDKTLAHPLIPFYMPRRPARYVVELHASRLPMADVGDRLERAGK
jgi:uncharacterized membrane protein (UPF0127 family)